MGLKNLAENIRAIKPQAANNIEKTEFAFMQIENKFTHFLRKIEIEKAGFLSKTGDFYKLCFPIGFDITTFHRFFIDAYLVDNLKYEDDFCLKLSMSDLSNWRFFLSSQEYAAITDIFIFPIVLGRFFLFAVRSKKDSYRTFFNPDKIYDFLKEEKDFFLSQEDIIKNVSPVYPLQKGRDTISLKIQSAVKINQSAFLLKFSFAEIFPDSIKLHTDISKLNMYYSVVNKIIQSLGQSAICILKPNKCLYACLFSNRKLPIELYIDKIKSQLLPMCGSNFCNRLSIECCGIDTDVDRIQDFLYREENDS